jgi:hypothetical protein
MTPTPIPDYDFEGNIQDWGEHRENENHISGQGVTIYCETQPAIKNSGNCSLRFMPTERRDEQDVYVTVLGNVQDSIVTAHVFVPREATVCVSRDCSTAKIIVWDRARISYESDFEELVPGTWVLISWDLRGESWPGPWREFGIHFYLATDYRGPFYIDTITTRR